VSGRAGDDARSIVGVPELTYVGNHGLELEPDAAEWAARLAAFLATVDWPRIEDKGLTASLHYRDMDEDAARRELDAIAQRARSQGFVARYGRKVLELLPPLEANKGTAVQRLLAKDGLRRALYAGDDTTDLDGFEALEQLELGVRVAVASAEGPRELTERADIVLAAQSRVVGLLRAL
jgi:trehalose 6-phosphate phosphatase